MNTDKLERDMLERENKKLIALIASLKRCGTCRHCRSHDYYDALCAIDKKGKSRRDTCDKWEIDENETD